LIGNTWKRVSSQLNKVKTAPIPTPQDYRLVSTPSGFLSLCTFQGKPVRLFDFQRAYVDSVARFIAVGKSRQLGHSEIGLAGTTIAKSHLFPPLTSILVSYNLKECKEKIQKALMFHEGVPATLRSPIKRDNAFEIEFRNGSRILSVFSPRGFTKADVYLDEMSFYENQQRTYTDASAVIAWDQNRQLRVGGTPFGKIGLYYDIVSGTDGKFPDFERHFWFWWDCPLYCKDVERARFDAHLMPTEERVYRYGTKVIIDFFNNMFLEDFQQEFEICFNDSELAYFPYELIKMAMSSFPDIYDQEKFPSTFEQVLDACQGMLFAGYDVGRTTDASEFYVLDLRNIDKQGRQNTSSLMEIFHDTLKDKTFEYQKNYICRFLDIMGSRCSSFYIDRTGIGFNLAEDLEALYPGKVQGIYFNSEVRSQMVATTKAVMLDGILHLFPDREVANHFYSIKKHITNAGNMVFVAEKNKKHHADKFWAIALAVLAARQIVTVRPEIFTFGENWNFSPEIDMFNYF